MINLQKKIFLQIIMVVAAASTLLHGATTWYVSSSQGSDSKPGTSPDAPIATLSKVNTLALEPGDRVLFKRGDMWRSQMLIITKSGTAANPIIFGAYPDAGAAPVLSGSYPLSGWTPHSGTIYKVKTDVSRFPYGINQLFRKGKRLPMGRWPNISEGDGYARIDESPSGNSIRDADLPAVNWTGAVIHVKGMNWYIQNRIVTASSGTQLTFNEAIQCCQGGCGCPGWGYFLNSHLLTLDSDGEWYFDSASSTIYLYSNNGAPPDGEIEGSVILKNDDRAWGGCMLGDDFKQGISYVIVENIEFRNWFRHGIASPTNLESFDNHHIIIRNCTILDADKTGISLATWVYSAKDNGSDGWRGGTAMTVINNRIDIANERGIDSYSKASVFRSNHISNVALIGNLGRDGMGCGMKADGGLCTENGDGIRIKIDKPAESGTLDTLENNFIENTGYNGIDIFGPNNILRRNIIKNPVCSKQDGGGIRLFGDAVKNVTLEGNTIIDAVGTKAGTNNEWNRLFAFGIYIDWNTQNIYTTGNTVFNTTAGAILYQNSSGTATGNILYGNTPAWADKNKILLSGSSDIAQSGTISGVDTAAVVFYNTESTAADVKLDNFRYTDLKNNQITGSVRLDAGQSIILIRKGILAVQTYKNTGAVLPEVRIMFNRTSTKMLCSITPKDKGEVRIVLATPTGKTIASFTGSGSQHVWQAPTRGLYVATISIGNQTRQFPFLFAQ